MKKKMVLKKKAGEGGRHWLSISESGGRYVNRENLVSGIPEDLKLPTQN